MRSTHTLTISIPPAMTAQIDRVRRKENRTRSELIREALRSYFAQRYPTVKPTKANRDGSRGAGRRFAAISSSHSISFSMLWTLRVAQRAAKSLKRAPAKDRTRLVAAALGEMRQAPFAGDIVRVQGQPNTWRRRVGDYRIFFEVSRTPGLSTSSISPAGLQQPMDLLGRKVR